MLEKNLNKALTGAYAEKPLKDLARELVLDPEHKKYLDQLAELMGEKAIEEYEDLFSDMTNEFSELPEIKQGQGIWQNKFHEFDVYNHTLEFVRFIKDLAQEEHRAVDHNIVVAGYLHDIAKPAVATIKTTKEGETVLHESGKPRHNFRGHEETGEKMVLEMNPNIFKKYDLDQKKISLLVGMHFRPMKGFLRMQKSTNWKDFTNEYDNLVKSLDESSGLKKEIMEMFTADSYAKGNTCTNLDEMMMVREALSLDDPNQKLRDVYKLQKERYGDKAELD